MSTLDIRSRPLLTAEDLPYVMPDEMICELVRGELICESLPSQLHGLVAATVLGHLFGFVRKHRLGRVYAAETGFVLARGPDTVRGPDVAFVATDRTTGPHPGPFFEGAPDLAVEVLSPGNTRREIAGKVRDYFAGGAQAVWVIDPNAETATVHLAGRAPETLARGDALDGGSVLPGFRLPLSELFDE
jgi:Uma2 family endonuclease